VIVPIWKNDDERALVLAEADKVAAELADFRLTVDRRQGMTPGFKFNDWEMRGVPLRIEIGPRDVSAGTVMLARRDRPGREGKTSAPRAGLADAVRRTLDEIQQALYDRALAFRDAHTHDPRDYAEFSAAVEDGFAISWWCGSHECEEKVKADTKATTRCIPLDQPEGGKGRCIVCGGEASAKAVFGKAY
jgi:prolyl-tRNA synthetase